MALIGYRFVPGPMVQGLHLIQLILLSLITNTVPVSVLPAQGQHVGHINIEIALIVYISDQGKGILSMGTDAQKGTTLLLVWSQTCARDYLCHPPN